MSERVRLIDIARELGISKATVSMALRENPRISAETRQKVQAAAERLGYVPDPALRRLAEKRWANRSMSSNVSIAFVTWSNDDYPNLRDSMTYRLKEVAGRYGYGFENFVISDFSNTRRAVDIMLARGVSGILAMASAAENAWHDFPWHLFSGVELFSGSGQPTSMTHLRPNNFGSMLEAGERVIRAGCRSASICLIKQQKESITDRRDHAAALYVIELWKNAGIECTPPVFFNASQQITGEVADYLLKEKPEVAILPNPWFFYALEERAIAVPESLKVIVLGRKDHTLFSAAGFTKQYDAFAERSVAVLDGLIRIDRKGGDASSEIIIIPDRWIDGDSFPTEKAIEEH